MEQDAIETQPQLKWLRSKAIETGSIEGVEYCICKSPGYDKGYGGLNGYAIFLEKPVKEPNYDGILTYVPVHGGITYCEHEPSASIYGFDTGHYGSESVPRFDPAWVKGQIGLMVLALKLAATLEDKYLAAEDDNEARAKIAQRVMDLSPEEGFSFGVMINLLSGQL